MGSDVCACVVLEWCVARDASGNVVVFFFFASCLERVQGLGRREVMSVP